WNGDEQTVSRQKASGKELARTQLGRQQFFASGPGRIPETEELHLANCYERKRRMTCREVDNLLYPYLDGEFEPGDRLELEQHLSICSSCAHQVHSQARFRELLRQTAREAAVPAPTRLRQGIEALLRQAHRRRNLVWVGQVSAAAAMVLIAGAAYWFSRP